ncbi:hypothetical protein SESBI_15714 [Sesbania bispinosa]|nr:hypothetical protein SESBI_15714 [Sesbania bispinosa]
MHGRTRTLHRGRPSSLRRPYVLCVRRKKDTVNGEERLEQAEDDQHAAEDDQNAAAQEHKHRSGGRRVEKRQLGISQRRTIRGKETRFSGATTSLDERRREER